MNFQIQQNNGAYILLVTKNKEISSFCNKVYLVHSQIDDLLILCLDYFGYWCAFCHIFDIGLFY